MSGYRYDFTPRTTIILDASGKVTAIRRNVLTTPNMEMYEEEDPPPTRRPWLWRTLAWASAFAWLTVLLWLDRYT